MEPNLKISTENEFAETNLDAEMDTYLFGKVGCTAISIILS